MARCSEYIVTLICAKFAKDLFNIYKVASRKIVAPFLAYLVQWAKMVIFNLYTQ